MKAHISALSRRWQLIDITHEASISELDSLLGTKVETGEVHVRFFDMIMGKELDVVDASESRRFQKLEFSNCLTTGIEYKNSYSDQSRYPFRSNSPIYF